MHIPSTIVNAIHVSASTTVELFFSFRTALCTEWYLTYTSSSSSQGELVDHTLHLLPAGLAAGSGEVVPWKPRLEGPILAGVSITLEGSKSFKVLTSMFKIK